MKLKTIMAALALVTGSVTTHAAEEVATVSSMSANMRAALQSVSTRSVEMVKSGGISLEDFNKIGTELSKAQSAWNRYMESTCTLSRQPENCKISMLQERTKELQRLEVSLFSGE